MANNYFPQIDLSKVNLCDEGSSTTSYLTANGITSGSHFSFTTAANCNLSFTAGGIVGIYDKDASGTPLRFSFDTATNVLNIAGTGGLNVGSGSLSQKVTIEGGHIRFDQVAAPSGACIASAVGSGGSLAAGDYKYKVTFVCPSGETELGPISNTVTVVTNGSVNLTNIPVSSNVNVTGRRIYRTKIASPSDYFLVDTILNNSSTTYTDIKSDAQIGGYRYTYTTNSTAGSIYVNSSLALRISPSETAIGYNSLPAKYGFGNAAFGNNSLVWNTGGYYNCAFGENSLGGNTTGVGNSAFGAWTMLGGTITGYNNTAIGSFALQNISSGNFNTATGTAAGNSLNSGSGNVFVGYQAGYYETGSNKLFIDNTKRASEADARTKALVYGVFDASPLNQTLTINGSLNISPLASTPSNPTKGTIYFYDTDNHFYGWNGTAWKQLDN